MVINNKLRLWCILGLILSLYATYVEIKLLLNKDYRALCDLAPKLSCTAVFNSQYGKSFGFLNMFFDEKTSKWNPPNGIYGIIYYTLLLATTFLKRPELLKYQIVFCVLSNIMSLYLAYLLYILENICVVCVTIYVVNFLCLWEMLKDFHKLWLQNRSNFIKIKSNKKE
ncbi:vitamin K epoxide reductase complex subunit 1 [Lucilia cuprina]|uniref:vitamin K epoxide reductase complex subunit 1 n=1 Tax=Lucilia cuprina TaxID=7375 RepID=UPI001F053036|nr:vitamin K epoxide reductase complex subunit 1 [Lucilia cuprina]